MRICKFRTFSQYVRVCTYLLFIVRLFFDREFAERIILCNSLVWACEETGKSGLTYLEALEHEKNARKLLNDFPVEVRAAFIIRSTNTNK